MKKFLTILLAILMLTSVFSGTVVFGETLNAAEVIAQAAAKLNGMYTAQSLSHLYDCYDKATANPQDEANISSLKTAIDSLSPLVKYTKTEMIGFDSITAEQIAEMKLCAGTVTNSKGVITLSGEGTLRYSNASADGVIGVSPFGVACENADGFVLRINSAQPAALSLEIGLRGSVTDCLFVMPHTVSLAQGDNYYFFPFDRFGNIPLNGSLNYISLSFEGTTEVSFSELHAAGTLENAVDSEFSETKLTAPQFDCNKFYKIYEKGTNNVFELVEDTGDGKYLFTQPVDGKSSQEWQIISDIETPTRFRIINKLTGTALSLDSVLSTPTLTDKVPNQTNTDQEWSVSYNRSKGFSFTISNRCKLSYSGPRLRATATSSATKYFDVYEVPGENWNLAWEEGFNDGELNSDLWFRRVGKFRPDREPIYHRSDNPENIYFEDGNLVIRTEVEEYEGIPATGAYIDTYGKHQFSYGRIEVRAKLPEGDNIWPAAWLMSPSTLGWPGCGELDIIEMVGTGPDNNWEGEKSVIATIHCGMDSGTGLTQGSHSTGKMLTDNKLSEDYHLYAVEWSSEAVRWYWDDILFFSMPIDVTAEQYAFLSNPMFMILNTAIDGTQDNILPEGTPYESFYYIDYIRYYVEDSAALPEADPIAPTVDADSFYTHSWEVEPVFVTTPDGSSVIVSGQQKDIKIYNIKTGELTTHITDTPFQNPVHTAAVTPDGSKYFFMDQWGDIYVCPSDFSKFTLIEDRDCAAATCHVTPDGSKLVVYGRPLSSGGQIFAPYLHAYDTDTYELVLEDPIPGDNAKSLVMSSNGYFAATGVRGITRLYSPNLTLIAELQNDILVPAVSFSGNNKLIATCNTNGVIRIWNVEDGTLINTIDGIGTYDILDAKLNEDGSRIVCACDDFSARIFDTATGKLINRMTGAQQVNLKVSYSPNYQIIAVSSGDSKIRIYDADGNIKCILQTGVENSGNIDRIAFSPDGMSIAGETFKNQADGIAFWTLPEDIYEVFTPADFSALENIAYYDELLYTPETYARYHAALVAALAVKVNRYSSQEMISQVAEELKVAEEALEPASLEPEYMKGDFDFDEKITVADALAALRIAAKMVESTDEAIAIGDIDNDGKITVSDSLAILRVAAKMADSL